MIKAVISPKEAAKMIQDNVTIATSGFVCCASPEALGRTVEEDFWKKKSLWY